MNPHLSINPFSDLHQMLVFPFMVNALEAGTIVAVMASLAGWFMVLRRETFAGHTLAAYRPCTGVLPSVGSSRSSSTQLLHPE